MVWATSLHFGEKTLDCLEPGCLISLKLLKLKIQLTCTASGLRILNRHSKGHQEIWKPHLIDHTVLAVSPLLSMWEWEPMSLQSDH